jgi:Ca2+/Na+ antiporter
MLKLLRGERVATPLQIVLAVAVLILCLGVGLFSYSARQTAKNSQEVARASQTQAERSQKIAQDAIATERAILTVIVDGCGRRVAYDTQAIATASKLHDFGAALSKIVSEQVIPPGTDPKTVKLFNDEKKAIGDLTTQTAPLTTRKVINNCSRYAKLLADLPKQ